MVDIVDQGQNHEKRFRLSLNRGVTVNGDFTEFELKSDLWSNHYSWRKLEGLSWWSDQHSIDLKFLLPDTLSLTSSIGQHHCICTSCLFHPLTWFTLSLKQTGHVLHTPFPSSFILTIFSVWIFSNWSISSFKSFFRFSAIKFKSISNRTLKAIKTRPWIIRRC